VSPEKGARIKGPDGSIKERPMVAEQDRTECEHGQYAGATPLHAGLLHALLDHNFTDGLDDTRANRVAS